MSTLIIGGTGTLGHAVTTQLLKQGEKLSILSRCELKQKEMSNDFKDHSIKFILGDIRDKQSIKNALNGIHTVYHFAALKHVDILEHNPIEAMKTNTLGTLNVLEACQEMDVLNLIFTSTDKAVRPINAYGCSKAMAENILLNKECSINISVCRYGNVLGSRGSAIPYFIKCLKDGKEIDLTDKDMTRFWIRIEDAAEFVISCNGKNGLKIPKMKASKLTDLIEALATNLGKTEVKYNITGIRMGEKIHEDMLPYILSSNNAQQFTIDELKELTKDLCSKF